MVKTRTELEAIIEGLRKELSDEKEKKLQVELECESLRQGLQKALAVTSTYENLIHELEEENKNLINELANYQENRSPANSDTDALLVESLEALNLMRTKIKEEKELNEILRKEIAILKHGQAQVQVQENAESFRIFADRLCEELVLLEEDNLFLSKYIKSPETDIYQSNKGRNIKIRSPYPGKQEYPDDLTLIDDGSEEVDSEHNEGGYGNIGGTVRLLLGTNHRKPQEYSIPHQQNNTERIDETEELENDESGE